MRGVPRLLLPQSWRFRLWLFVYAVRREHLRRRVVRVPLAQLALTLRILAARLRPEGGSRGLDRLGGIVVINLKDRTDRLAGFRATTQALRFPPIARFEGIPHPDGAVGCARSHIAVIERMLEEGWESAMICEDDARFAISRARVDALVDAFLDDPNADVLCLGYRQERVLPYSRFFLWATATTTRSCYVVKAAVAEELLDVWRAAVEQLEAGGENRVYAGDQAWKRLQRTRRFLISTPRAVYQESGYSDIRRRVVSFAHEGDWRAASPRAAEDAHCAGLEPRPACLRRY
jgi:glycosyl transferase family 25